MLTTNNRVVIIASGNYSKAIIGFSGTIIKSCYDDRCRTTKYGVQIDTLYNTFSSQGLFWLTEKELMISPDISYGIKKVIFNKPKTIILWIDGSKTIVSCSKDDVYDPYAGFCAAVAKKIFGSSSNIKKIMCCCADIKKGKLRG